MTEEIRNILSEIGYNLGDFGDSFRAKPIYRDSGNNTSLCINKKTGKWIDFSINIGGSFEDLIKLSLNLKSIEEAKTWLSSKIDLDALKINEKPKIPKVVFFSHDLLSELIPDHKYWIDRGISKKTLEEFKGGLVKYGQMANRYTFPIFNSKNKILGFVGRAINNNIQPKYKIIGAKNNFIWPYFLNEDLLKQYKKVILVESPGCVLKCWDLNIKNVICLFGTNITKQMVGFLLKLNFQKIIIATNNEPDNNSIGNDAAVKIKEKLIMFFDEDQIKINLPSKKDVAEMSDLEIKEWYKNCD